MVVVFKNQKDADMYADNVKKQGGQVFSNKFSLAARVSSNVGAELSAGTMMRLRISSRSSSLSSPASAASGAHSQHLSSIDGEVLALAIHSSMACRRSPRSR